MSSDLLGELNNQGWLTTPQVAAMFGVSRDYVSQLARTFKGRPPLLPTYKVGHLLLIRRELAERYQATHPRLGQTIARRARQDQRVAS